MWMSKWLNKVWPIAKVITFSSSGLLAAGAGSNRLCQLVNDGYMPVVFLECERTPGALLDATHSCMRSSAHLVWLADWIHIDTFIYSPGDLLLSAGVYVGILAGVVLLLAGMVRVGRKIKQRC
jgi:hypothetical protein